ncbi:PepSY domain-containing protein [Microbacterium sp. YY-01]|uniref:PepSY domain-containing protein n=1 Tax=Microbacterium sp. YY-01 TaxID=3421634 RepID=UPI003D17A124
MSSQRTPLFLSLAAVVALAVPLSGCTGGPASPGDSTPDPALPTMTAQPDASEGGESGDDAPGDAPQRGADLATTNFAVSWEQAVETARAAFDGELTEVELDWSRDRYAYTVELVNNETEYEAVIDATTGEIVREETDSLSSDDAAKKLAKAITVSELISLQDALDAALAAQPGEVEEWSLEGERSGPVFEFDIDDGNDDYEVTIDARTGKVIEIDD